MRLAVGSSNPVKINAAKAGAMKAFSSELKVDAEGFNVSSSVSDQPVGDEETLRGAMERATKAFEEYQKKHSRAPDFAVGLEGGVRISSVCKDELECFAWMVVYDGKSYGKASTASFSLPPVIRDLVLHKGMELGHADDHVFGTLNSKQNDGTVGQLTKGVINRTLYYEHAIVLAFIPFQWPQLYQETETKDQSL